MPNYFLKKGCSAQLIQFKKMIINKLQQSIAYNDELHTFGKPKKQLTLNIPSILSEIQRKHITAIYSRDLPKIGLPGNSYMHRDDWTIGRLVVIHRTGGIYTPFRTDICEISASLGMYRCYATYKFR
jgi:hypothetical protein